MIQEKTFQQSLIWLLYDFRLMAFQERNFCFNESHVRFQVKCNILHRKRHQRHTMRWIFSLYFHFCCVTWIQMYSNEYIWWHSEFVQMPPWWVSERERRSQFIILFLTNFNSFSIYICVVFRFDIDAIKWIVLLLQATTNTAHESREHCGMAIWLQIDIINVSQGLCALSSHWHPKWT